MRGARAIRQDGTPIDVLGELTPFQEFLDLIGLPEIDVLAERFTDS